MSCGDVEAGTPGPGAGAVRNLIISLVVDATDAEGLARFWGAVLGWKVVQQGAYGVSIGTADGPLEIDFRLVPDGPKTGKNRLHLDITPVHGDLPAERERLLALGAREVDVGQGQRRWYVLADAEGNEFCLCPAPARPISSATVFPNR
jgi:hypothetical protein